MSQALTQSYKTQKICENTENVISFNHLDIQDGKIGLVIKEL